LEITKVGVVGGGTMGSGIAQVCARAGYPTIISEVNDELLQKALATIRGSLDRQVQRDAITERDIEEVLSHIKGTTETEDLADCQLVIESIVENMDVKKKVFADLDAVCPVDGILASNSSCLSLIEMAMATKRPDRLVGLHFFNPPTAMNLVELVRTVASSEETVTTARAFAESLGKTVVLAQDTPGFIVNRLLIPYLLDAVRALETGVATMEDIDQGMVLGCNMPIGPLALSDLIGLDTLLFIADSMYEDLKDNRLAAPSLLRSMVRAGRLGRKTRTGFHDYT
jgi:3-hydroxybutyryl-CoA dehydrogenase